MIAFGPIRVDDRRLVQIQDVVRAAFVLAQSAQDVADAVRAIFTEALPGSQTLTLGTTAPDSIQTLTPTRWVTIVEADGLPTIVPGYR